jgi:glycosyltransferase involved in cell wall biosynthesis
MPLQINTTAYIEKTDSSHPIVNILFLSPSLSRDAGGIFEIEKSLAKALIAQGAGVEAIGLDDANWPKDRVQWEPVRASVVNVKGPRSFGYSPELIRRSLAVDFDVVHLHALWMYPSIAARRLSQGTRRPYVVTPNGMLEPWALKNSAWKKRLAGMLYENRVLHGAACLQANTEKELQDFRAYGLKNPIAVIPNGIDLPEETSESLKVEGLKSGGKKTLLFLGRLHPKKGLVNALRAWKQTLHSTSKIDNSTFDEWQFVIAGWDQGGHKAELKRLCREIDISEASVSVDQFLSGPPASESPASVLFVGPAFGQAKETLLRYASAFILPSFSEGLPMSVLEAWSYGLPVLMTDHCNLPKGFAADAALRIRTDVESIAEGMRHLLSLPTTDNGQPTTSLSSLGRNGRALVERQFAWPMIAAQMKEVYDWMLGGGPPPSTVVTP